MNAEFDYIMHSNQIISGPRNKYNVVELLGIFLAFVY
jgi:hypothetical protein